MTEKNKWNTCQYEWPQWTMNICKKKKKDKKLREKRKKTEDESAHLKAKQQRPHPPQPQPQQPNHDSRTSEQVAAQDFV